MIGILIKCCANCGYNKDDRCTSRDTLITTVIADNWCPEWKEMEGDDGIEIKCSTKEDIPQLIRLFLSHWKEQIIYLNNEENRILAEFRDALLPELMSGNIEIKEEQDDEKGN